ncbi:MAG: virulence factor SrfB, partial [Hyphomicrobium sp.]
RNDAFPWPSIARIGKEAQRLSMRASATPGTSGLAGFASQIMDQSLSERSWRFSRDELNKAGHGPVVSGAQLIGLKDDGTPALDGEAGLKPRFSRSSLSGFFFTELLLQALSQLNPPRRSTSAAVDEGIRRIGRVVLAAAADTPDDERDLMLTRLREAVDNVWDALGWTGDAVAGQPRRPEIRSGLDPDIAAQFVYLFDEITLRFGGNAVNFFAAARMPRARGAAAPALRVASVRLGSDFSRAALVDYKISSGGTIVPQLGLCDRYQFATGALLDAAIDNHIQPAIVEALARAGCLSATDLVTACSGRSTSSPGPMSADFAARFRHRILEPAGQALLDVCNSASADLVAGLIQFELADLVRAGGGRLSLLAAEFDRHAAAAGAKRFALAETNFRVSRRALSSTLRACIRPVAVKIAATLSNYDCDLIMLTGNLPALGDVESELLAILPLAPHRIINLLHRQSSLLQPAADEANIALLSTRAVGVALASRTSLGATGFNLITSTVDYPASGTRRQPLIGRERPPIAGYRTHVTGHEEGHS